ncbi:hypothetical protein HPB51_001221 [Rhipicephalus microplus]|uniref:BED-type domain-containing protein n=1 Tax=Rhipicephalus microplus TaxID=6941 RepID=A0A9J6DRK4_RHIMP|nr:hypothetical protein HPB51_001221 [Rhipicephalus microplus]
MCHASYGLFVASAVISAIGVAAAALCIWGAYTDQRHLLLPYLVFEGLFAVFQGVVIIIVIVAVIASGDLQLLLLLCALMLVLALQIYFLMVVVSFYKQLAFISQNPGQVGMTPDLDMVNSFVSWDILTAGSQVNSEGNDEAASGHHELDGSGRWTWLTGGLQWHAVALASKHPFALLFTRTSREPFLGSNGEQYSIYEHSYEDIASSLYSLRTVLRDKLAAGELKLVSKQAKKSQVWKQFLQVVDVHTLSPVGHVQCKRCKAFFAYDGEKTETSHLNRHECKAAGDTCTAISSFFTENKPQASSTVKGNLTTTCVKWCAENMRPFDVVCDDGFLIVADELTAIRAKYGSISARTVIPHLTTVSRRVSEVANELQEVVMPEIQSALKEGRCSMTLDMWSDDHKKIAYITAKAHYVSVKRELRGLVLFTNDSPPPPEIKTGENILKDFVRRSAKLRIDESMCSNLVFGTDQGANVISALRPYARMNCCAHVLNTVLRNAFDDSYLAQELPDLLEQLQKVKAVVTFFKTEQTDVPATTRGPGPGLVISLASLPMNTPAWAGPGFGTPGSEPRARAELGLGLVMYGQARARPGLGSGFIKRVWAELGAKNQARAVL